MTALIVLSYLSPCHFKILHGGLHRREDPAEGQDQIIDGYNYELYKSELQACKDMSPQ